MDALTTFDHCAQHFASVQWAQRLVVQPGIGAHARRTRAPALPSSRLTTLTGSAPVGRAPAYKYIGPRSASDRKAAFCCVAGGPLWVSVSLDEALRPFMADSDEKLICRGGVKCLRTASRHVIPRSLWPSRRAQH